MSVSCANEFTFFLAGIRSTRISLQWDTAPVSDLAIHSSAHAYTDPRFLVCSELSGRCVKYRDDQDIVTGPLRELMVQYNGSQPS